MTETGTLTSALLAAQSAMQPVLRTGKNQAQGWAFVEASEVVRACRKALTDAGLVAYMRLDFGADSHPDWLHLSLTVTHAQSGETLDLAMPWPITRGGDQGRRAAFTYARKQALLELLMVADPDDDPETRALPEEPAQPLRVRRTTKLFEQERPQSATNEQLRKISAIAVTKAIDNKTDLLEWLSLFVGRSLSSGKELSHSEASRAIVNLNALPDPELNPPMPDTEPRDTEPGGVAATPERASGPERHVRRNNPSPRNSTPARPATADVPT